MGKARQFPRGFSEKVANVGKSRLKVGASEAEDKPPPKMEEDDDVLMNDLSGESTGMSPDGMWSSDKDSRSEEDEGDLGPGMRDDEISQAVEKKIEKLEVIVLEQEESISQLERASRRAVPDANL